MRVVLDTNVLVTHEGVAADTVHAVVKAMIENTETLAYINPLYKGLSDLYGPLGEGGGRRPGDGRGATTPRCALCLQRSRVHCLRPSRTLGGLHHLCRWISEIRSVPYAEPPM